MWFFIGDHLAHPAELKRFIVDDLPGRARPPRLRRAAVLRNFRLRFEAYAEAWGGGVADVVEAPGKSVAGMLIDVPEGTVLYLDAYYDRRGHWSGRELGAYRRLKVQVLPWGREPAVEAVTYQLTAPACYHVPPTAEYLDLLEAAACDLGHSQMWLAHLRSFRAERRELVGMS